MIITQHLFQKRFLPKGASLRTRVYDIIHEPFPMHTMNMNVDEVHFLKAQNSIVFSENYIRWAAKYNKDTIAVCIHPDGCSVHEMFEVSKEKNPEDYQYLEELLGFDSEPYKNN